MSASEQRLRGATRWSSLSRCERMAYYGYLGVEPEPFDEQTKRRVRRGKLDEQVVVEELRERYGDDDVIAQKIVPWPDEGMPLGELHTDAFVVSEKMPIEIKSHANGEPTASDWIQLAGQVRFDEDADGAGALTIADRDLNLTTYPLILTDDLRAEVDGRVATLREALEAKTPPPRRCEKPADGRGLFCPFISHCFDGWQPPPAADFDEPELAARAYLAKKALDEADAATKELKQAWEETRDALLAAGLPEGESRCGPLAIRRTVVRDSERVSLSKIRASGVPWNDELYSPFVTFAGGHDRIRIDRVSDEPLNVDYGEVPF